MQPQFEGFRDRLDAFELWRGKKGMKFDLAGDNYAGKFKVSQKINLYKNDKNMFYLQKLYL